MNPGLAVIGSAIAWSIVASMPSARAANPPPAADALPSYGFSYARGACSAAEKWSFSSAVPAESQELLKRYLDGKSTPSLGLAYGEIVRYPGSKVPELGLLGRYLQGRSYYDAGLIHLARETWDEVISAAVTDRSQGIQTAALECLNRLHRRYPSIPSSEALDRTLPRLREQALASGWRDANLTVLRSAAEMQIRSRVGPGSPTQAEQLLAMLEDGGPYRNLAYGLWHANRKEWAPAQKELEAFVQAKPLPQDLAPYRDEAYLTLGRAYFLDGKYAEAIERLKEVDKDSNYTVRALIELAWSHLMRNDYPKAVGVAVSMQKGSFGKTFGPEAMVALAITFNELCQFPQSFRSIRLFYKRYRPSHDWLYSWYQRRQKRETVPLYPMLLQFIQGQKNDVPSQVMSEWARSPVFAAAQEEINLLIDSEALLKKFRKVQYDETMDLYRRARALNVEIRGKLKSATAEQKRDPEFRRVIKEQYTEAMRLKLEYNAYKRAVASYRGAQGRLMQASPSRRQFLVEQVERDLSQRNVRMLNRIRELIETAYLVQVEIYNGASEDIVWRNAHPEYAPFLEKLKKESKESSQQQVWNWGGVRDVADEGGEVWEDELDSMRARLTDNCSSRDRFTAVSMSEAQKREEEAARVIVGDSPAAPAKEPAKR